MSASHGHEAPPPDEPKTPMWLPALGGALFVAAAIWWAVSGPINPPIVEEPSAPQAASAPKDGGTGVPPAALTVEAGPELQKLLEQMKKAGGH